MSNKNRNQQQQRPQGQQQPAQQEQQQVVQQQQGQEDQAQQNQASQDIGTEQQQSNDQAGAEQAVQQQAAQEPVQEKAVEKTPAPAPKTQQEGFTPVFKIQLDLTNYAEAVDKKKAIAPEDGARWQYSLFNTIKGVLNAKDQEEFNKEWNTALVFFHQNKDGIFNENFLFRWPAEWPGSQTEYTIFRRILYVMIQTANAKTRKAALKDINMELAVEGLNEKQRTKLLNFYEA